MRVCAPSTINNYCVHVNYYCLRKQLALVRIPQASKQLIVTLKVYVLCRWGEGGTQLSCKPFLVVSFQVLEFQMFVRLKITAHWSGQRMHAGNVFFCLGPLLPALPSVYQWHWRHSSDKKDQAFPLYNRWTKSPCEWFFHKMEQSVFLKGKIQNDCMMNKLHLRCCYPIRSSTWLLVFLHETAVCIS